MELFGDTPCDDEWEVFGDRMRGVRWLAVDTGLDEDWIDGKFPLEWPLEVFVLSSACGTLVTTPAILEGRIPHLVLLYTSGLRFEGPDNQALSSMDDLDEQESEEEERGADQPEKTKSKIKVVYLPGRVTRWLTNKYKDGIDFPSPEGRPGAPPSRLRVLEILENDAIDTFQRFALACSHVVDGLERLYLRSTSQNDFPITDESLFPQMLPGLQNLRHLQLCLGSSTFGDEATLPGLYKFLPPNLESFRFCGPPSLASNSQFEEWIKAFGQPDYLPNLKTLSFAFDVIKISPDRRGDWDNSEDQERSKENLGRLLCAARARGVTVEEYLDPWAPLMH